MDLPEIGGCFLSRAHVGFGDYLKQGGAGAVEVNGSHSRIQIVDRLPRIFFSVRASDTHPARLAVLRRNCDRAFADDWCLKLADLIALR